MPFLLGKKREFSNTLTMVCHKTGPPSENWATHHACMKQTRCPSSRAKRPSDVIYFQSSAVLLAARKKRGRDRLRPCSHHKDDWGPQSGATRVDQSKVGLTTLPTISPCCNILLNNAKEDNKPLQRTGQSNSRMHFQKQTEILIFYEKVR